MADAMDLDDNPRGAKRKADALDDATGNQGQPRRIKVRLIGILYSLSLCHFQYFLTRIIRLWTPMW